MMKREHQKAMEEAERMTNIMWKVLAGKGALAQGAALAHCVATFIAGHHPELRGGAKRELFQCIDNLIPICVDEMIAQGLAPADWNGRAKR